MVSFFLKNLANFLVGFGLVDSWHAADSFVGARSATIGRPFAMTSSGADGNGDVTGGRGRNAAPFEIGDGWRRLFVIFPAAASAIGRWRFATAAESKPTRATN